MAGICFRRRSLLTFRTAFSPIDISWKSLQHDFYRHAVTKRSKCNIACVTNVIRHNTRLRPRPWSSNLIATVPNNNVRYGTQERHLLMPNFPCLINYSTQSGDVSSSKAWQIGRYGGNESLKLVERQTPVLKMPHEVLIKVHAASVNPIDLRMSKGYGASMLNKTRRVKSGDEFPLTLGRDCSGVVVSVGKGVKDIEEGDNVWASVNAIKQGCHGEYVVATMDEVSHRPKSLTHVEAASIPYAAITTWSASYAVAKFRPTNALGKRALIFGGSGGIGTFGIQLLNAWGGNVTVTCNQNAFDLVYDLGAHHAVDYNSPDIVNDLLKHGKYDFILNAASESMEDIALQVIKERAYAQCVSLVTPFMDEIDKRGIFMGGLASSLALYKKSRQFAAVGGTFRWAFAQPNSFALKEVAKLVDEGKIRPVIDKEIPFKDLPLAFERVEKGHTRGKVVVNMTGESAERSGGDSPPKLFE